METARIGGTAKSCVSRLTLTDTDRQVRDWLKSECERLGCTVTVDEVGQHVCRSAGAQVLLGAVLDYDERGTERLS